jgi:electron transfer flavoprotein beta subunit
MDVEGPNVSLQREIDGGKETLISTFPIVLGAQKGLVEESDLIIPNMRGIMQARQKPLTVESAITLNQATSVKVFEKPPEKGPVKLVDSNDVDGLIELLQNEAKVL